MNLKSSASGALSLVCLLSQLACSGGGKDPEDGGMGGDSATGGGSSSGGASGGRASGGATSGGRASGGGGSGGGPSGGMAGGAPDGTGGASEASGGQGGAGAEGETCGPKASLNADGTLTPYPNIAVTLTPAADYSLVSFNLMSTDDGDDRGPLLEFYAELKNESATQKCQFLPSVYLGFDELITVVDAEKYHWVIGSTASTTTNDCIQPGETGVMRGVQRGITVADLEAASTLEISPGATNYETDEYRLAEAPLVSETEVVEVEGLYALSGKLTYTTTIFNQSVTAYPRDARGLLVGKLDAYPGDLETHTSGSTADFVTSGTACKFVDFELTQKWIVDN